MSSGSLPMNPGFEWRRTPVHTTIYTDAFSALASGTARGDGPCRIRGRGTRALGFDGAAFRIVHEHLSVFSRRD